MRAGTFLAATLGAIAALAASGEADAATVPVMCTGSTTALSDAISSNVQGTVLAITGICQETVFVAGTLSLVNHLGTDALESGDGIQGELVITGTGLVVIDGIMLEGTSFDTGLPDVLEVNGSPTVVIKNAEITKGQRIGLSINGSATVNVANTSITQNGLANKASQTDGINAVGATLLLGGRNSDGTIDTTQGVTITDNVGNGIALYRRGSLVSLSALIMDNGGNQVFVAGGSNLDLSRTSLFQSEAPTMPAPFALQAIEGSTVALLPGTSINGGPFAGAILIASASSLFMNGAQISSALASIPTLQISGGSNAMLGGGNTIGNGNFALQLDHASSFQQVPLAGYSPELVQSVVNYTPAPDFIDGSALVQEQSQIDLGMGTVLNPSSPVAGNAALGWSVLAGNCILVQQNSSIRLSGGVTIAGAPPSACALNGGAVSSSIVIQQQSNGFFNLAQGGADEITNGGSVTCAFAGTPNGHVTGKANITPSSAQPVMIGSLEQALNATLPGCLGP